MGRARIEAEASTSGAMTMARPAHLRQTSRRAASRVSPPAWRPTLETLEDRTVTDAALPNIAVISATTPDSRGVVVTYQVRDAEPGGPVPVAIYRSADNRFDSTTDVRLGKRS